MKDVKTIQTEIDEIDGLLNDNKILKDKHNNEYAYQTIEVVLTARKQALQWVLLDEKE